ncbi:lacZ, partial [Symbiodinium sp. CCMP2456]
MEAEPCPRAEHPNPLFERREWRSLNGAWDFCIRPAKDGKNPVKAPESWEGEILVPFCLQSPLSGALAKLSVKRKRLLGLAGPPCAPGLGKRYELWYRRCLRLPSNWRTGADVAASRQRVILHIGACDYTCLVIVNGVTVGKPHIGGSTAFECDITEALRNTSEDTVLIKCADHEEMSSGAMEPRGKQLVSKAYAGKGPHVPTLYSNVTGLWQSVWVELVAPRRLRRVHCAPRCLNSPEQEMDNWELEICPELPEGCPALGLEIEIILFLDSQRKVPLARASAKLPLSSFRLQIPKGWVRLWGPSSPYLYGLKFRLFDGGTLVDEVMSYTALRVVSIRGDEILLNRRPLFLRLVLDQGYYPDGLWTAPAKEALKKDIQLAMSFGFNGARLHQKAFEPWYYRYADELGFVVFSEYPDWNGGFSARWEVSKSYAKTVAQEWECLVADRQNHP